MQKDNSGWASTKNNKYTKAKFTYNGTTYGYTAIHRWISRHYGKADRCEGTACTQKSVKYQWSNISHEYKKERSDWQRLCLSCHAKFDTASVGQTHTCKKVEQYDKEGNFIKTWDSLTEAAKFYGIRPNYISHAASNRYKTSHGFIWKYANTNKMS